MILGVVIILIGIDAFSESKEMTLKVYSEDGRTEIGTFTLSDGIEGVSYYSKHISGNLAAPAFVLFPLENTETPTAYEKNAIFSRLTQPDF